MAEPRSLGSSTKADADVADGADRPIDHPTISFLRQIRVCFFVNHSPDENLLSETPLLGWDGPALGAACFHLGQELLDPFPEIGTLDRGEIDLPHLGPVTGELIGHPIPG